MALKPGEFVKSSMNGLEGIVLGPVDGEREKVLIYCTYFPHSRLLNKTFAMSKLWLKRKP